MAWVEIYYARVCGLCTKALAFFRSRGVTFTAYAVEGDREKEEFMESANTLKGECGNEEKIMF